MDDWVPPVPEGYDATNRAFLQAFMARGTLTFSEAQKILAKIKTGAQPSGPEIRPSAITMADFTEYVQMAREAIEPLDYDIRIMRHQVRNRGEKVWVFLNAHSDGPTQIATTRTPEEVAYIKRLLDAMYMEYNTERMEVMAVNEAQALKISRPPRAAGQEANGGTQAEGAKGLKHSEVLSLLASLVAEGWLEKSAAGFYSLSPRSLVELWGWLSSTYNDEEGTWQRIKFCEACKEIVTHGQRCANLDCVIRLHDICQDDYWATQREKKCPKCKTAWDGEHFVGERAVTSRSGYQRGRGGRRSGAGRRSQAAQEEDGEDGE
ncbi:Nse1 non-SMC component of SMC5-6 complex-domain-containing protein [Podospora conica]|nr:Nse1 non-SMC component of SMC5-6 complex-domain-containing protein [Schizothecium conicum]